MRSHVEAVMEDYTLAPVGQKSLFVQQLVDAVYG